jgi:hypothetical protein
MTAQDLPVDAAFTKGLPKIEVRLTPPASLSPHHSAKERSDFRSLHC